MKLRWFLFSSVVVVPIASVLLTTPFFERAFAQAPRRGSSAHTAVDLRALNPFASRAVKTPSASPTPVPNVDAPVSSLETVASNADVLARKGGEPLVGVVEKISGRGGVSFRAASDVPSETPSEVVPTSEIERVDASVGPAFRRGLDALESGRRSGNAGDFRRALDALREARQEETRRWTREWATSLVVESLVALGELDEAANEFFLLARLDPYSAFLPSIPLRWTNRTTLKRAVASAASNATGGDALESAAATWLDPNNSVGARNPVGRLLAASILLTSPTHKNAAIAALQELVVCEPPADAADDAQTRATCRTIALLATAQLWRLTLLQTPTEREVDRWEKTLALLPDAQRLGPTLLVARGSAALGRDDAARRAFLRVALSSTSDRALAEAGFEGAVDAFERSGARANAERLRAEARRRFAQ